MVHFNFLQSDNWDGDGEMGGYGGGDGYPEGGLEEHGESEVQGVSIPCLCSVCLVMEVCVG